MEPSLFIVLSIFCTIFGYLGGLISSDICDFLFFSEQEDDK